MNNELSAESNLNNLITVNFTETMTPEIELTETELEAMDDIRFSDELTAMVAELPVFTDEQNTVTVTRWLCWLIYVMKFRLWRLL